MYVFIRKWVKAQLLRIRKISPLKYGTIQYYTVYSTILCTTSPSENLVVPSGVYFTAGLKKSVTSCYAALVAEKGKRRPI